MTQTELLELKRLVMADPQKSVLKLKSLRKNFPENAVLGFYTELCMFAAGETCQLAAALRRVGETEIEFLGEVLQSWRKAGQSLRLARELRTIGEQNPAVRLQSLRWIANEVYFNGDLVEAVSQLTQAVILAKAENHFLLPRFLSNRGMLYGELGEARLEVEDLEAAQTLLLQSPNSPDYVRVVGNLGNAYARLGNERMARQYFLEVVKKGTELHEFNPVSNALIGLASLPSTDINDRPQLLERAVNAAKVAGAEIQIAEASIKLAPISKEPQTHLAKAESIARAMGNTLLLSRTLITAARIDATANEFSSALSITDEVLKTELPLTDQIEIFDIRVVCYKGLNLLSSAMEASEQVVALERKRINEALARDAQNSLMRATADRARYDLEQERMHRTVLNDSLNRLTNDYNDVQIEVIYRLALAAEIRDDATGKHTLRVSWVSGYLAEQLGLSGQDVEQIKTAALLHDIGKIAIPDYVLLKKGKLTQEETVVMRRHTEYGRNILSGSPSPLLKLAEEIAYGHHEWFNGNGYPQKLIADQIPLSCRIVTVADVFDALMSVRQYKDAWSLERTLQEFEKYSGTHFDPRIAEILIRDFNANLLRRMENEIVKESIAFDVERIATAGFLARRVQTN